MITSLPRFLRRADAVRSLQSSPDKTRLTVQFVNPSTSLRTCLSTALETCFALRAWVRSPTQAGPSRLRFSVLTVNFTFHDQPLPTRPRALVKSESRVQTVNFTFRDALIASTSFDFVAMRFSVSFVNFAVPACACIPIRRPPLEPQKRVRFVNFTFHNRLCAQIPVGSARIRFTVLTVNFTFPNWLDAQEPPGSMTTRFSVLIVNLSPALETCFTFGSDRFPFLPGLRALLSHVCGAIGFAWTKGS